MKTSADKNVRRRKRPQTKTVAGRKSITISIRAKGCTHGTFGWSEDVMNQALVKRRPVRGVTALESVGTLVKRRPNFPGKKSDNQK